MEFSTTIDGTSATIAISGNLTVAAAPDLEAAFADLPEDVTCVIFDISELAYIASAGLRVFVACEKDLKRRGGGIRLVHPNEEVMEVLEVTGLVDILTVES